MHHEQHGETNHPRREASNVADGSLLGWVLAAVGVIVSTLAGIVAKFYSNQVTDFKAEKVELKAEVEKLKQRADKCEAGRNSLLIEHAVLNNKYAELEKRVNHLEVTKKNRDSIG